MVKGDGPLNRNESREKNGQPAEGKVQVQLACLSGLGMVHEVVNLDLRSDLCRHGN